MTLGFIKTPSTGSKINNDQQESLDVRRLIAIDCLRACGALMVLWHHGFAGHLVQKLWASPLLFWPAYPFLQGFVGVHLFLVVSGFCIHGPAARKNPDKAPQFVHFFMRRFLRLYPPYLAAVLLTLVALPVLRWVETTGSGTSTSLQGVWGAVAPKGMIDLAKAAMAHLLLAFPFMPGALGRFGNPVFWTLALESQLYLMYFALPVLRRRLGWSRSLLLVLVVTLSWRFAAIYGLLGYGGPVLSGAAQAYVRPIGPGSSITWMQLGPSRWFEWVLGAFAVEIACGHVQRKSWFVSAPIGCGAALAAMVCQWSHIGWVLTDPLWGIAFFILINRAVEAERDGSLMRHFWTKPLAVIGIFSYSLYLVHEPILKVSQPLFTRLVAWPIALPAGMLLVLPIAWVFYKLFECPAVGWSKRAGRSQHTNPSPVTNPV